MKATGIVRRIEACVIITQNLQCKGVRSGITKQDAIRCIIHTYICLGDILALQEGN